jgi:hypothetical protein
MDPSTLFSIANGLAASGWIVLAANAVMRREPMLWPARLVPLVLAAAYLAIVAPQLVRGGGADFGSLAGVQALFGNPWWTLAGWLHYLAFDLLIGSWQSREALRIAMPRPLLLVCLFLTFMLGPIGWLLFVGSARLLRRSGEAHAA